MRRARRESRRSLTGSDPRPFQLAELAFGFGLQGGDRLPIEPLVGIAEIARLEALQEDVRAHAVMTFQFLQFVAIAGQLLPVLIGYRTQHLVQHRGQKGVVGRNRFEQVEFLGNGIHGPTSRGWSLRGSIAATGNIFHRGKLRAFAVNGDGSPLEAWRIFALTRLARPSMLIAPCTEVLVVCPLFPMSWRISSK